MLSKNKEATHNILTKQYQEILHKCKITHKSMCMYKVNHKNNFITQEVIGIRPQAGTLFVDGWGLGSLATGVLISKQCSCRQSVAGRARPRFCWVRQCHCVFPNASEWKDADQPLDWKTAGQMQSSKCLYDAFNIGRASISFLNSSKFPYTYGVHLDHTKRFY